MLRPFCLAIPLLFASVAVSAQTLSIFAVPGENANYNVRNMAGYSVGFSNPFHAGADYGYNANHWLSLHTGLEYTRFTARLTGASPDANFTNIPHSATSALMEIPLSARFLFCKYAFFQTGLLWDFQLNNANFTAMSQQSDGPLANQTGLGLLFNLGPTYTFHNGLGLEASLYIQSHDLFIQTHPNNVHESLFQYGPRVALNYAFHK